MASNHSVNPEESVIDSAVAHIIIIINWATLCFLLGLFGTATNFLNLIVFIKQGFQEPINVSLLALTISDFMCTFGLIWHSFCFNPVVTQNPDLPFIAGEVQYLILGWPRLLFTRVTGWITAFIAIERCACIVMPLKVKHFITPRRNATIVVTIYVLTLITIIPVYYTSRLVWKTDQGTNRTRLGLSFIEEKDYIDSIAFYFNTLLPAVCCMACVSVCTVILVSSLQAKSQWRQSVASHGGKTSTDTKTEAVQTKNNSATRDQHVAKMVSILSVIFVVSYSPEIMLLVSMMVVPELNVLGSQNDILQVGWSFSNVLVGINSSVNILVYMNMSTKFRTTFMELCHRHAKS